MTTAPLAISTSHLAWGLEKPCLGLSLGGAHKVEHVQSQRHWVEIAEAIGIHSVWLPEMHFAPGVCPAPLIELAGFAALTERIRFGTTSLLLPLHPPEEIAAEIAALDRLCNGRLLIGLGRGFHKKMLEAFGVDPAQKRDRFDEALDRILSLWSDANETGGALATHQRPHPPLAVAAFGPKGLAQAASHGLPYLASPVETFDQIADNQARHRALLPESSPAPLSLIMRTVFVSDSEAELRAARDGLEAEIAQRRAGMPAAVAKAMDAPLDERVVIGNPEVVRDRLSAEQKRLGIDLLIVRPTIAGLAPEACEHSLRTLTHDIWPEIIR